MIVKINLLPWRDEKRLQEEKKAKSILIVSCMIGAALAVAVVFWVNQELENRMARMASIDAELTQLGTVEKQMNERKAQNDKLRKQLDVLQKLAEQRSVVVALMEKFSAITPEDAFILDLSFTLNDLKFSALARDRDVLAVHLDKIDAQIGDAPIPPVRDVEMDGNKFISYDMTVKPRVNK